MSTLYIFPESAGAIDWGERILPGCICVGAGGQCCPDRFFDNREFIANFALDTNLCGVRSAWIPILNGAILKRGEKVKDGCGDGKH